MEKAEALLELISQWLDEGGITYTIRDDEPVIDAFCAGESCRHHVVIHTRDHPTTLLDVVVLAPEIVSEEQRTQMAEAITRANHRLPLGCFELDMSDGGMSFRANIPVADAVLTREQFLHLLLGALCITDTYHRAFNRLLYGDDLSPVEAIAEVEMAG
jgi:hypothetical protein